jgi:hypothetical protein
MARGASRPARWSALCARIVESLDVMENEFGEFDAATQDLEGLKEEYEEWRDNLPEGLEATETADKLDATIDAADAVVEAKNEMETLFGQIRSAVEDAEGADLPRGFGRD